MFHSTQVDINVNIFIIRHMELTQILYILPLTSHCNLGLYGQGYSGRSKVICSSKQVVLKLCFAYCFIEDIYCLIGDMCAKNFKKQTRGF